jgi:short-subunit dehydrogenase
MSTSRGLAGRIIAITGASAGIGAALGLEVARRGARVALFARRADRLATVAREITAAGGEAITVAGDVAAEADMVTFVGRTIEAFGTLDVMVANAGAGYQGPLATIGPTTMARLMDVNFMGTFLAAKLAWPVFEAQHRGHLVVVSSIVGRRALAGGSAYAATKFAQVGLAEALRAEGAPLGIHVTTVFPVSTETEFRDAIARDHGVRVSGRGPAQSAARVAATIAAAIERPRPEVYPYPAARLLAMAAAASPRLTDLIVSRLRRSSTAPAGADQ